MRAAGRCHAQLNADCEHVLQRSRIPHAHRDDLPGRHCWHDRLALDVADHDERHRAQRDGDIGPLQALEISYLVGQSRATWIFAMDEFLMCVGCAVTAWLTLSSARGFSANPLSKKWAGLTALLSFVTLISFLLNATRRLAWFKLSIAAGLGMAVIYMVLLPIWLIWLGMQLSERSEAVTYMGGTGDMDANVNMASKSAAGPSVDVEMSSVGHSGDVV